MPGGAPELATTTPAGAATGGPAAGLPMAWPLPLSLQVQVATARTLADAEAFAAFHERHEWHPEASRALYHAALSERGDRALPFLVQCSRGGEPVALLVGQLVDAVMAFRVGYLEVHRARFRQLEVLQGGVLGIVDEEVAAALWRAVQNLLRRGGADAVWLRHLPADSPLHRAFTSCPGFWLRDHLPTTSVNWRARLPASFAEFGAARGKRWREDHRRCQNKIRRAFGEAFAIEDLHQPAEVARALHLVESIAVHTYQRGLSAGFQPTAETRARWEQAAAHGQLRVHVLHLAGRPAAFATGYEIGDTLWLEHLGFHPDFRACQPGVFLLHTLIERLIGGGKLRWIDFGVGDADYKRRLCDERQTVVSLCVFAASAHGVWRNLLRTVTGWVDATARRLLARLGLVERCKRWWRRRLGSAPEPAVESGPDPRNDPPPAGSGG